MKCNTPEGEVINEHEENSTTDIFFLVPGTY